MEDAINAAKAAIEEGIVPEEERFFAHSAELDFSDLPEEERQGAEALRKLWRRQPTGLLKMQDMTALWW